MRILLATTVNWPSAARLAGAFAGLGCAVDAVFPAPHPIRASRYLRRGFPYRPLSARASFAHAVRVARPDLVVPCDDRALLHLMSLDGVHELMARSLGALDNYPVMMARAPAIAIARDEGVLAPATIAVETEKNLWRALDAVGLPAVLKSDGSWGGDGVTVVQSPEEALLAFRRLANPPSPLRSLARAVLRRDAHFLLQALAPHATAVNVQRFVPGRPATTAFACRGGEVLAALHMDVVAWRGATGPATVMQRTDCPQMADAAGRIARRFRLNGLHGLDFVRDGEGMPHLIEINPRATQICHLALGPGHDLPAALLGLAARPVVTDKHLIALFPQPSRSAQDVFDDVPWDDPALLRAVREPPLRPVLNASAG